MAQWIKRPDNSYVQIAQVQMAVVRPDPTDPTENTWAIWGVLAGPDAIVVKTGYASQTAAQNALDTAIGNLGGSV